MWVWKLLIDGFLGLTTELDAVSSHSEVVPDTVIFDDFERSDFPFVFNHLIFFSVLINL